MNSPEGRFREALDRYARQLPFRLTAEAAERLAVFYGALWETGQRFNLTRRLLPEEAAVWHVLDTLLPLERIPEAAAPLLDLGSGAGVPGLIVAAVHPEWEITLLEATGKKARFLRDTAAAMGLPGVRVLEARAEEAAHGAERGQFRTVTARAVAALPVLLEWALPFLQVGGRLLAWKGPELSATEAAPGQEAARLLGGREEPAVGYLLPGEAGARQVLRFVQEVSAADRFPRPYGQTKKRPLGGPA